jgi:MFS transporter, FHS family, L-fucose permease
MAMITTLFFMWGFITCLNDILAPHLKAIFDLSYARTMLIQFAFFSAYFIFSIPSGKVIEWIGYRWTMVAGLLTMALGALLFIPAASVPSFGLFLTALMVLAAGITALQVAANPYVAILGPPEGASSRLVLTQAFNSLGTTLAPYLGSVFILASAPLAVETLRKLGPAELQAYRLHEAATVKLPYLAIAAVLVVIAVLIARFHWPSLSVEKMKPVAGDSIWRHPRLLLGAVAIFVYVGGEVSIGSFLVSYLSQPEIGALAVGVAGKFVSFYWGGAMIGRFLGSALLRWASPGRTLGCFAAVAALLVCLSMLSTGHLAMGSILVIGFFNSIMFPTIFTLAIEGLGALTSEGSGLLCAAIVGGAVIPLLQGLLADRIGIHHAFLLPVLCYLYIVFFGFKGSRLESQAAQG